MDTGTTSRHVRMDKVLFELSHCFQCKLGCIQAQIGGVPWRDGPYWFCGQDCIQEYRGDTRCEDCMQFWCICTDETVEDDICCAIEKQLKLLTDSQLQQLSAALKTQIEARLNS